jgi:hypothetical protein
MEERIAFSTNDPGTIGESSLSSHSKIHSEWTKDLNVRDKI